MQYIDVNGRSGKSRRFVSRPASASVDEVKDPAKLTEIIRQLSLRVQELEAKTPSYAIEFERNVTGTTGAGVNHSFAHNLGGPVRWYVVHWSGSATTSPALVYQTTSTADVLVLKSHSAGSIVLRIEPSQHGVT